MRLEVTVALAAAIMIGGAQRTSADADSAAALLAAHRGAVVQIQVKGKINNSWSFEYGTGFLVNTSAGPRIVTAGHVIGPDNKWDELNDRCIYYRLAQNGSSAAYDCVLDAKVENDIDLAEVYLDPFNATTLAIAPSLPSPGAKLVVASWRSWGQPGSRATAQDANLLLAQSDKLVLSGSYERSDSGSPVIDDQGRVVGVMVEASAQPGGGTQGIALPVTRVAPVLVAAAASPVKKSSLPALGDTHHGGIVVDALAIVHQPGCFFLGKRSAIARRNTADMPFGLSVLQNLIAHNWQEAIIGKSLAAETGVNLRADCPTVVDGSAYYAPARAQLSTGDRVTVTEVLALNYLDDTFYWARGEGSAAARQ